MAIKEKLKSLVQKVREHKVKAVVLGGLAALTLITALKDNVHFGSVTLHNPKENHYSWGIVPKITIEGNAEGNFYSVGLLIGENNLGDNSTITGNQGAYGLFAGGNVLGDNSTITGDMISRGIFAVSPKGTRLGTNIEIGLENYVHKVEKKEK